MSSNKAPQRNCKSESEDRNVAVSFKGKLDVGELLTGTPTVPAVSGLTFSNEAVNTSALTVNGKSVAVGEAAQWKVTGGTAGTKYNVIVFASTDATPAQVLYVTVEIEVIAD